MLGERVLPGVSWGVAVKAGLLGTAGLLGVWVDGNKLEGNPG